LKQGRLNKQVESDMWFFSRNRTTRRVLFFTASRKSEAGIRNTMLVLRFLHDLEQQLDAMNSGTEWHGVQLTLFFRWFLSTPEVEKW